MNDKPKKFMFDLNDFSDQRAVNQKDDDKGGSKPDDKPKEQTFSEAELEAARLESYQQAVQETTQKIQAAQQEREILLLENIGNSLAGMSQREEQRELSKNIDTARLTLSIIKKLMPEMARKHSEGEIKALIKQVCQDRADEPRIVVSVHETMLERLRDKIDNLAASLGFQGQVVMIADENMSPPDCRIEWADGGLEKDFEHLYKTIEREFMDVLNRHNAPPAAAEINDAQTTDIE